MKNKRIARKRCYRSFFSYSFSSLVLALPVIEYRYYTDAIKCRHSITWRSAGGNNLLTKEILFKFYQIHILFHKKPEILPKVKNELRRGRLRSLSRKIDNAAQSNKLGDLEMTLPRGRGNGRTLVLSAGPGGAGRRQSRWKWSRLIEGGWFCARVSPKSAIFRRCGKIWAV